MTARNIREEAACAEAGGATSGTVRPSSGSQRSPDSRQPRPHRRKSRSDASDEETPEIASPEPQRARPVGPLRFPYGEVGGALRRESRRDDRASALPMFQCCGSACPAVRGAKSTSDLQYLNDIVRRAGREGRHDLRQCVGRLCRRPQQLHAARSGRRPGRSVSCARTDGMHFTASARASSRIMSSAICAAFCASRCRPHSPMSRRPDASRGGASAGKAVRSRGAPAGGPGDPARHAAAASRTDLAAAVRRHEDAADAVARRAGRAACW